MDVNQCPRCQTRFRGEITVCPVDGEALQRLHDPLLGRTIAGRYLIEDKIGDGGMGVVYRATHQVIARDVAIKFLHPRYAHDVTSRRRFLGEARAANQINHENIIDITDFGETDDGLVYLVMEYLQGRGLDREIAGRPMSPPRALRIAIQIAQGLGRAHELDVIHRDVKPGNVFLVRRRADSDVVKLLDFGIARFEREMRITDRGTLLGTPEYIAPEQVRSGEVSPHTDLYALGCVLFEMLVGEPPFRGNMTDVLVKQLRDAPDAPSARKVDVSPDLDALVLRMLHKDPARRHRDAFHLVEDLRAMLGRMQDESDASNPSQPTAADAKRGSSPSAAGPSSRPPSDQASRPTLHVPVERDDWRERLDQYRQRLRVLHPDGALPAPVREAIHAMEKIVTEAARLRFALYGSAQELTESQQDVRATRLRIGRALDELAADESKLGRAHDAQLGELSAAEERTTGALQALLSRAPVGPVAQTQGKPLSEDHAAQLQELAGAIEQVRDAQAGTQRQKREHAATRASLDDVRFQIEQLKGRLASLNAASSATQSEVQERMLTTEFQLRSEMDRLVSEAEHVALYLREREPRAPARV